MYQWRNWCKTHSTWRIYLPTSEVTGKIKKHWTLLASDYASDREQSGRLPVQESTTSSSCDHVNMMKCHMNRTHFLLKNKEAISNQLRTLFTSKCSTHLQQIKLSCIKWASELVLHILEYILVGWFVSSPIWLLYTRVLWTHKKQNKYKKEIENLNNL